MVQIPESLFFTLCKIILDPPEDEYDRDDLWRSAEDGLIRKLEAMKNRSLYRQYRSAVTSKEREDARLAYLDARGVPDSFRSPNLPEEPDDSLPL